jgi:hypothetical protein
LTRKRGESPVTRFRDLPQSEGKLSVTNGMPGLDSLIVLVNGHYFKLQNLRDGEARRLDVTNAMHVGNDNTIVTIAHGAQGTTALLVISD